MNRGIERVIAFLLSAFLLLYTGYQVMRYFEAPYETQVALNYSVADTTKVTGVIVREEQIITDSVSGVVSYLHDDGTKVTQFNDIAEIYSTEGDVVLQKQIRALEEDIAMLRTASDKSSIQFLNAEILSRQIAQAVGEVVNISAGGMVGEVQEEARNLTLLLNRNQIFTGKAEDFEGRISELTGEKERLTARLTRDFTTFKSPTTGYFVRLVDGLEETLTPETALGMTVKELEALSQEKVVSTGQYLGKLVTDQNWYYSAIVSKEDVGKFAVGDGVALNFSLYNLADIPFTVTDIKTDETSENAVVTLRNNYVLPALLDVRNPSAEVVFKAYSGLKIPASAKRFEGQTVGVYVLENDVIRFKTISIVYENAEFILCGANPDTERPLKLFDQVIVEGNDLRDGKTIQ